MHLTPRERLLHDEIGTLRQKLMERGRRRGRPAAAAAPEPEGTALYRCVVSDCGQSREALPYEPVPWCHGAMTLLAYEWDREPQEER